MGVKFLYLSYATSGLALLHFYKQYVQVYVQLYIQTLSTLLYTCVVRILYFSYFISQIQTWVHIG